MDQKGGTSFILAKAIKAASFHWRIRSKPIREFLQPTSQHHLPEFTGLINFYRHFVPHCTTLLQPLNALSPCTPKGNKTLQQMDTLHDDSKLSRAVTPKRLLGTLMRFPWSSSCCSTIRKCCRCSSVEELAIRRS